MVEMRYVLRDEILHQVSQGLTLTQKVKVLQYRQQVKTPKKDPKLLENVWEITWSEWIDVPTVEEGK